LSNIKIELYLPKQYNNKKFIENKKFLDTYSELIDKFGKISKISSVVGNWIDPITKDFYEDDSHVIWIICNDSEENKIFFLKYKEILKERFHQKDILLSYYHINTI
jgi:hypothetical protein